MKLGILAPRQSWHFQDLYRAAKLRGDVDLVSVDFVSLAFAFNGTNHRFFDKQANIESLDALIVRTMPHGSLQQVVFRMDLLHRIQKQGMRVVNSPRSVEIAIDKYLSLSLMSDCDTRVPPFAVCQSVEQGLQLFEDLGGDVVLKPIFGSMGKHIHRFRDPMSLKNEMQKFLERGEVIYLQRFINHDGSDIRIFLCGDHVAAMKRVAPKDEWLTNVAQGGIAELHQPSVGEIEIARAAAKANCCEIAGVDLVYAPGDPEPYVLEVNAAPGWEALQSVTETDIAAMVLRTVMKDI